jgi:hypothetical protein
LQSFDAVTIARRLSTAHPEALLPCPACAVSLKARNLDRHLSEVHQLSVGPTPRSEAKVELSGVDGRVVWLLSVPVLLWLVGVATWLLWPAPAARGWGGAVNVALLVLLLVAVLPLLLAMLKQFRARLVVEGDRIELCYAFGLLRVVLERPVLLESGSLWTSRPTPGMHQYEHASSQDVRVGTYLRAWSPQASIIIGTSGNTQLRKHWSGARPGPRRRRSDITLDRVASVSLQYQLAARGVLEPLSEAEPAPSLLR